MTCATKRQYYIVGALFFLVLGSVLQIGSFASKVPGTGVAIPRSGAVSQKTVFPTQDSTLYTNRSCIFTTALRDDSAWNRVFDGGNLTIIKSGVPYSTQYLLESGSFNNCSYSFQNDAAGTIPNGWTGDTPGATSIGVVNSAGGHQKIVQLTDTDATSNCSLTNTFTSRERGTIELWVRKNTTNQESSIMVGDFAFYVTMLNDGTWGYIDASDARFSLSETYVVNKWYHLSVDFENSTGGYKGLGQAMYNLRIDGITIVSGQAFRDGNKWIDRLTLVTAQADSAISLQVDAVDYSWSPTYVGNRSACDMSPLGFYNATDSFENELVFSTPSGWNWYPGYVGAIGMVMPGDGGHRKYTSITGSSIGTFSRIAYSGFGTPTYGTIEVWLRNNSTSRGGGLWLGGGGNIFFIMGGFGYWGYFNPGTWNWHSTGVIYSADTWYHVRVEFECTTGEYKGLAQHQWNGYVNGVKLVNAAGFRVNTNALDVCNFEIPQDAASPGYNRLDFDAVDFSFDPGYFPERSSYALVQLPQRFSEIGSYSFLYTLNSSGVGYSGTWTDFQVAVKPNDDLDFWIIFIWIIGSVVAVAVPSGMTIQWRKKKSRAMDSNELRADRDSPKDHLFLASARMVQAELFQGTPVKLNAVQEFRHVDNSNLLQQEINRTVLSKTNQIVPGDNHRIEIQNTVFYVTCRPYVRQNLALVFASTDRLHDSFFPILDSAIDLQFLKDHELIDHPDILLKYLVETLHLERSFDYNVAVPAKMNVLQSSALWKSSPTIPQHQVEVEEDLKSMTTSDARAAANYIDSLKESFEPDDNQ